MTSPRPNVRITYAQIDELPPYELDGQTRGPWWAWGILLVLICLAAFAPAVAGTFLPQDDENLTAQPLLRSWQGLWGIWNPRVFYRLSQVSPLGYTLFLVEYRLWGSLSEQSAVGYRVVSIVLHLANAMLLWTLLRKLDMPGAFAAAAIFAAHPVQVQSVSWISQQPALLGTMLALLSVIVYLRFAGVNPPPLGPRGLRLPRRRIILYILALLLFILAILAKPALAVLPLVVLALIWWDRGAIGRGDLIRLLPMLLIAGITWIGGMLVFQHRPDITGQQLGAAQRLLLVGPSLWFYLFELTRPGTFSFVYPRWDPNGVRDVVYLVAALCVVAGLWLRRRQIGRGPTTAAIVFVALIIPHILFVDVDRFRDSFVADSAMYTASAALIVPIVSAIRQWLLPRGRELSVRAAAPWIAVSAILLAVGMSFRLSRTYASAELLWASAIGQFTNSVHALNCMGQLQLEKGDAPQALAYLKRSLQLDPANVQTRLSLGAFYERTRDPDRAYAQYYSAWQQDPDHIEARCGMARALAAKGDYPRAIGEYQKVLSDRPGHEVALHDLAMLYTDLGRYDDAVACYQRAIQSAPSYIPSHINLANLYLRLGKWQEAIDELERTQRIDPRNDIVQVNIGTLFGKLSELTDNPQEQKDWLVQSERAFRAALHLNPRSAHAADNLGVALLRHADIDPAQSGKRREAVFYFSKALSLDPSNATYKQHLETAQRSLEPPQAAP